MKYLDLKPIYGEKFQCKWFLRNKILESVGNMMILSDRVFQDEIFNKKYCDSPSRKNKENLQFSLIEDLIPMT